MRKSFLHLAIPLLLSAVGFAAPEKPNIVFILCDDLGYGDIGVFHQNEKKGPRLHTPHLDKLAKDGIQLRAHYAPAPVCAPSRASLFLGQHQGNSPIRDNQFDKALPDQPTIASVLKNAGYRTALIGKYGLQGRGKDAKSWPAYPTKRGFDHYLGAVRHRDGHEHYPFDKIHFKNKRTEIWHNDKEISASLKGVYSTDLFTAASKKFLTDHKESSPEQPFFLFLSYDTPHAATQIATSPYPKGFGTKGGIQWIGKKNQFINTANDSPDSFIHPDYADKDWREVSKRYASSIRRIDNSVADIRQTLTDLGYAENTLIVFTSDHGPSKESYIKQRLEPAFFESFGPFTGIKRDCWEGGLRPGAIAAWPAKIKPGSITQSPSQMHDWMPTFCEIASTPTPAIADGVSLIPTLTGNGEQTPSTIYTEYKVGGTTPKYDNFPPARRGAKRGQMQAIRQGNLKAIRYNIKSPNDKFLVFDLTKDPAESKNLAGKPGIPDQAHWRNAVTRLHATNPSAKRPYDNQPILPVAVKNPKPGPKVTETTAKTTYPSTASKTLTGYIKIDEGGQKTFTLPPNTVLKIHGIHVTKEVSLNLQPGHHPFTLHTLTDQPLLQNHTLVH